MLKDQKIKKSLSSLYDNLEKEIDYNEKPEFRAKKFNINLISSVLSIFK